MDVSEITGWPDGVLLAYSEFSEVLSPDILNQGERDEYESFTNGKRKAEYLLGRGLFKFLLNELSIDPSAVEIYKEEKGKPFAVLNDEVLQLSFTHSPEMVMCALSRRYRIGLDVESIQRRMNEKVVQRILNEDEWQVIGHENPLKLWTIKEAALKCSGHGLQTNLKNLSIVSKNNNCYFIRFNNEINYEICSFKALNHQIALAYQSIHS